MSIEMPAPTSPDYATLTDAELERELLRLEQGERAVSRRRSVLHDRVDFRRAGSTAEGVGELETLEQREREISAERLRIHEAINAVRAEVTARRTAP